MWSISLRMMKRDGRMLIPAGIAVMIGSLFIAVTFLFGNALDASLRQMLSSNFGGANYALAPKDSEVLPVPVSDFQLNKIEEVQGVKGVRPDFMSSVVRLTNPQKEKYSSSALVMMSRPESIMPLSVVEGKWPQATSEVSIPKREAQRLGLSVGDQVDIVESEHSHGKQTDKQRFHLVGFTEDETGIYSYYGGACVLVKEDYERVLGFGSGENSDNSMVSAVFLLIDQSQIGSDGLKQISGYSPKGYRLQTRTEYEETQIKSVSGQTSIIATFLLTFGVLSMFVAALVISNTFQVMVARQRRTLALLRTIGAKKSQVKSSVLVRSGMLGLIASMLGTVSAIGLMALMQSMKVNLGGMLFSLQITPVAVIVPVVFGTVVTMLASFSSASAATRVSPLEALRPMELVENKRRGRIRLLISILLVLIGAAMTTYIVYQAVLDSRGDTASMLAADQAEKALAIAVFGVMVAFTGILLCANRWIPWMLKGIGSVVSHCGPSSTIAVANISRNPKRVAATGMALLIGVTLVSCLGTGASSAKQTLSYLLDSKYSVDVEVITAKEDQNVLQKIRSVRGVSAADSIAIYEAQISSKDTHRASEESNENVLIYGIKSGQSRRLMNVDVDNDLTDENRLVVPKSKLGNTYKENQKVTLNFSDPSKPEETAKSSNFQLVAGSFKGLSEDSQMYGLAKQDKLEQLGSPVQYSIWVKSDGTQPSSTLLNDIREAVNGSEEVNVAGAIALKEYYEKSIDIILMVMVALLAVAVLIALIGVANTLSLSVIERTRESATLRAIGMTKKQLKRSLSIEALLIASGSCLAGLVLGTIFAWAGSYIVFESVGKVVLALDWKMYGIIAIIVTFAAYIASVLPARRATKTAPVEALAEA